MSDAIVLDKLVRNFGERAVLKGVSLNVPAGSSLAILGRNGAGKSTLLRILATLLRPHGGTVRLFDHALPREAWAIRAKVGLLSHDPLLYRELSGRENLLYHARLHGIERDRVEEVLAAVGMARRGDDPVRSCSRGMVQRLAVARAVLHRPELLLLDEPKSNLDPAASELIEPLIGPSAVGPDGAPLTRVLTSHDPEAALAEADLVLALHNGTAAYLGPPTGIDAAQIKDLYR